MSNTATTNIVTCQNKKSSLTFADLLGDKADRYIGERFACTASIKEIEQRRGWYYIGCTECPKKLQPSRDNLACEDHGEILQPIHLYCLTATIDDDTASITATFFDRAVTSLIKKDCTDLVVKEGYTDPLIIPESIHSVIGKKYGVHLQVTKRSHQKSTPVIVTQVFTVNPPAPMTNTRTEPQSTSTSSPIPSTPAQKHMLHPTGSLIFL